MAVDRWGEKAVLLFSIVCMILSGPLYLSRYVHWIITAHLLIGFSRALYWPPSESYVSKGFGFTLERRLGFFNLAVGSGLILGPLLAGFLLGNLGFDEAFIGFSAGVGTLLVAVLLMPTLTGEVLEKQKNNESLLKSIPKLIKTKPIIIASLSRYVSALPVALFSSFIPVYLVQIGFSPEVIGISISLRGIFFMLGSLCFTWTFERWPRAFVWFIGMVGIGLPILIIPKLTGFIPLAACFALVGFSSSSLHILPVVLANESGDAGQRGFVLAFTGMFWGFSILITPFLFGIITEAFSMRTAFYLAGIPLLFVSCLTPVLFKSV